MVGPFLILLGLAAALQLLLASCTSSESWVILPNLSPPVAAIVGKPMERAEEVAKTVPGSFVLVAHGTAQFAMYPPGTALVIQEIKWEHLRPGMTAIYYLDREATAALTGGVLTRKQDGVWRVPALQSWRPPGPGLKEKISFVTKSSFAGVVVAAFIEKERYDPLLTLRNPPVEIAGTCVLRCHVPARR